MVAGVVFSLMVLVTITTTELLSEWCFTSGTIIIGQMVDLEEVEHYSHNTNEQVEAEDILEVVER